VAQETKSAKERNDQMKKFAKPEIKVEVFTVENIITVSTELPPDEF